MRTIRYYGRMNPHHGEELSFSNTPRNWPYETGGAVSANRAMAVTTDAYASEIACEVLRGGGNAVDAAVAAAFALAVVNPEAGNLGGSGFMVIRLPDGKVAALDYRSCAPRAASAEMFAQAGTDANTSSTLGHRAVAVPGSVRGMWDAHQRFGHTPWAELVEPAVSLARGFEVRPRFARSFEPHIIDGLARFPSSRDVFLPGGAPPAVGSVFEQSDLAVTLERIRDHGPDGFYAGATAELIMAEMKRHRGIIDLEDLASYRTVWRSPVRFQYRGHTIVSMPPPSSGGVTLALTANILSGFELGDLPWHGPEHVHLLVEAWKRAFADRNHYLADPDYASVPTTRLIDPTYGAIRGADISLTRSTPAVDVAPEDHSIHEGRHTTHVSVVDQDGSAVSLTTTINTWYGSKVVASGTGVLLNNDMDDFSTQPGTPNFFGLVQGRANAIQPGKRMLSAMSPMLVLDSAARLRLVVGSPGGATIITTVFQVLSNIVDHGMGLAQAVRAPRIHHQHLPDEIRYEPGGLESGVLRALSSMGHTVVEHNEVMSDVQAVWVQNDGTLLGQSDPRRGGAESGF